MNKRTIGRLPDFIAVGPPRTATTWLYRTLRGHVGLPEGVKETHFFTRNYSKGLGWYQSHFRYCSSDPVVGELCASYFDNEQARQRIRADIPKCKIICTLRDPVDRLYSFYKLMRRNGRIEGSLEQALRERRDTMLNGNRYASHVRAWQKRFGAENVLTILFDDLLADPQRYLDQVTTFIGTQSIKIAGSRRSTKRVGTIEEAPRSVRLARSAQNVRRWLGSNRFHRTQRFARSLGVWRFCSGGGEPFQPLDAGVKLRLYDLLSPEVEALEELLHRDLSKWKQGREPVSPVAEYSRPQEN